MKISLKFLKEQNKERISGKGLVSKSQKEFNKDNPSLELKTNSRNNEIKDLFYEISKEKIEKDNILNIKKFIANNINSSFELIYINNNPINQKINPENENDLFDYGLEDKIILSDLFIKQKKNENYFLSSFNSKIKDDQYILYFKEHLITQKISIEVIINLENITKIKLEVFSISSIYIIKELLLENNELKINDISEIVLFNNENPLNDNDIIFKIIEENNLIERINSKRNININRNNEFNNNNNKSDLFRSKELSSISSIKKPLILKMIKKGKKKFSIGIDLSFNLMKNISKIKYSEEAPNYREAKDGLNLICYCRNDLCEICNEMFLVNLGILYKFKLNNLFKLYLYYRLWKKRFKI
jgi:hypothetical protein